MTIRKAFLAAMLIVMVFSGYASAQMPSTTIKHTYSYDLNNNFVDHITTYHYVGMDDTTVGISYILYIDSYNCRVIANDIGNYYFRHIWTDTYVYYVHRDVFGNETMVFLNWYTNDPIPIWNWWADTSGPE